MGYCSCRLCVPAATRWSEAAGMLPSTQLHVAGAVTLSHLPSLGWELCDALLAPHVQVMTAVKKVREEDDYALMRCAHLYQHMRMYW